MKNQVYTKDKVGLSQFLVDQNSALNFKLKVKNDDILRTGTAGTASAKYESILVGFDGSVRPTISVLLGNTLSSDMIRVLVPNTDFTFYLQYKDKSRSSSKIGFLYKFEQTVLKIPLDLSAEALKENAFEELFVSINKQILEVIHDFIKSILGNKVYDSQGDWKLKGTITSFNYSITY